MAFNPQTGCLASVTVGSTTFAFDEWKFSPKNNLAKVTNFTSSCFGAYIKGITEGEITLSGPYDEGNDAWTVGNTYSIVLATSAFTVTVPGILKGIDLDVKVDDAARLSLTLQTTGVFTAATV